MLEIFKEPFVQTALLGGLITACLCAYLGVFVILKRIVFVGIALSQVAALGVALGLFVGVNPELTAFLLTLVGIILFWFPFTERNISREAFLGFTYAFCAATAIILIAKNPLAESRGLNLISGNLLYTSWADINILGMVSVLIVTLHALFFKEFIFVSFDRETALTCGLKANLLDFLLYLTIGIVISLSMKICGIVFVFASLVIPALTALVFVKRTPVIFAVSCLVAVLCVILGISFSYLWDLPSSPMIVVLYSLLFLLFWGVKLLITKK
ncbi:MAG: metal ABC transporter permease [Candidatus Omnitrophica bacterium]|nr:metal ABC transporter permease [Candidatus Omnitrophota bacterium]